jgi:hypothetical protein
MSWHELLYVHRGRQELVKRVNFARYRLGMSFESSSSFSRSALLKERNMRYFSHIRKEVDLVGKTEGLGRGWNPPISKKEQKLSQVSRPTREDASPPEGNGSQHGRRETLDALLERRPNALRCRTV